MFRLKSICNISEWWQWVCFCNETQKLFSDHFLFFMSSLPSAPHRPSSGGVIRFLARLTGNPQWQTACDADTELNRLERVACWRCCWSCDKLCSSPSLPATFRNVFMNLCHISDHILTLWGWMRSALHGVERCYLFRGQMPGVVSCSDPMVMPFFAWTFARWIKYTYFLIILYYVHIL